MSRVLFLLLAILSGAFAITACTETACQPSGWDRLVAALSGNPVPTGIDQSCAGASPAEGPQEHLGDGGVCAPSDDDSLCLSCAKATCCAETLACAADDGCIAALQAHACAPTTVQSSAGPVVLACPGPSEAAYAALKGCLTACTACSGVL